MRLLLVHVRGVGERVPRRDDPVQEGPDLRPVRGFGFSDQHPGSMADRQAGRPSFSGAPEPRSPGQASCDSNAGAFHLPSYRSARYSLSSEWRNL